MNYLLKSLHLVFQVLIVIAISFESTAQEITYDDFTMNLGYENMVYYSMDSGVAGTAPVASWDLAFDVRPLGVTALINGGSGISLFPAGPLSDWDVIDDTFALNLGNIEQYYNGTSFWSQGAFSQGGDGNFDVGWGVYDEVTQNVESDSMYVISYPDGSWKKFALLSLVSGVYSFQCANLDGTDFFEGQVVKSNYLGKIHAFYNLTNQEELDLEPSSEWDLLFFRYLEEIVGGVYYTVTGALTHPSVRVQEQGGLTEPFVDGAIDTDAMTDSINVIGYDWKIFTGSLYTIDDERSYFIKSTTGVYWQLVFAAFEGSQSGAIELMKAPIVFPGCTDENACNFIADAIADDGSCDYGCLGCTEIEALNWDENASIDDGSCIFYETSCDFIGAEDWLGLDAGIFSPFEVLTHEFGVADSGKIVLSLPEIIFEPSTGNQNGVTTWNNLTWSGFPEGLALSYSPDSINSGNQVCLTYSGIPIEEGEFEVVVAGSLSLSFFGQPFIVEVFTRSLPMMIEPNIQGIVGCTYPNATNYLPFATIESGTCSFEGCMDPEGINYQLFAMTDDGSCEYDSCNADCPADVDNDGSVGTGDLLFLLASFGLVCE